jgi:hypothetical protein
MRALETSQVVALWEGLRHASPTWRAVVVLSAGLDTDVSEIGRLSIGLRDAGLIALRRASYGVNAPCFVHCPSCSSELEFEVDLDAIRVPASEPAEPRHVFEHEGFRLSFRLPTSDDLRAIEATATGADAVGALIERCVQDVELRGDRLEPGRLPAALRDALAAEIGRLDPQADVSFELRCDACGHAWAAWFDISTYLWREIEIDARRLLSEVDALARAYGWSEAEILGLSRQRRRAYLELLGAA